MIQANDIITKLSQTSRTSGEFEAWVKKIRQSPSLAHGISKTLLVSGKDLCQVVEIQPFQEMVESVMVAAGMGKGVFLSSLCYMPEIYARIQLKTWMLSDVLEEVQEATWQSALSASLRSEKLYLASEIIHFMEANMGVSSIVSVMVDIDEDILKRNHSLWEDYREHMVFEYCLRQSFLRAKEYAQDDPKLNAEVLSSIARLVEFKGSKPTWPKVMQKMLAHCAEEDYEAFARESYKSAAMVAVKQIQSMAKEDIETELDTDELKLMAFKLGLGYAIHTMESCEAKRDAVEFALGL